MRREDDNERAAAFMAAVIGCSPTDLPGNLNDAAMLAIGNGFASQVVSPHTERFPARDLIDAVIAFATGYMAGTFRHIAPEQQDECAEQLVRWVMKNYTDETENVLAQTRARRTAQGGASC